MRWALRAVTLMGFVAFLAGAAPTAMRAQGGDDLAALNQRIEELYRARKYSEATPIAERALELTRARSGEDHINTATRMSWLGAIYREQRRYTDAEPLIKRSLEIRERDLPADHPDLAVSLNNLGLLYQAQARYADAEPPYKRSLAIREKALGPD